MLFTGIEGIGKRTSARLFAMAQNCKNGSSPEIGRDSEKPCGLCKSCRQIAEGAHPDIIQIQPEKNIIKISQIRSLLGVLAMKPFSATHRVVIIAQADCMNREAGNALLKVLEEPPADTTLILTAPMRDDLLPTISSRCRHIRFSPLSTEDLAGLLARQQDSDISIMKTIAQAAGGSYTRAVQIAEGTWRQDRDWLVHAAGLDKAGLLKDRRATAAMAFSSQLATRKDQIENDFEILKSWIRDLNIVKYQPESVVHRDRLETLRKTGAAISADVLLALWEMVEKAQKDIAVNGNLRLTLDVMALQMTNLFAA